MKPNKIHFLTLLIIISSCYNSFCQDIYFSNKDKNHQTLKFEFISNMIIIPISVNGSPVMNFILDTGLRQTILTKVPDNETIAFNYTEKTTIKGLGKDKDLTVWHTDKNEFIIRDIVVANQNMFVLEEDRFNLSSQMGIEINGIIGSVMFENFIVEIDYIRQEITFHKPKSFKYRKRHQKWESIPLSIYKTKPYINLPLTINKDTAIVAKLLIDSGASDALWLFPGTNDSIIYPPHGTELFLGQGLNGDIFGKQSKVETLTIGKYILNGANVSYPDTSALHNSFANDIIGRNGSIGSEILRRFDVIFDYSNEKILLKKNKDFNNDFNYNLSGLDIEKPYPELAIFIIYQVRKGSPADLAGLKTGDQLLTINGMNIINYTLNDIILIMRSHEGRKIRMKVMREGEKIEAKFKLKEMD